MRQGERPELRGRLEDVDEAGPAVGAAHAAAKLGADERRVRVPPEPALVHASFLHPHHLQRLRVLRMKTEGEGGAIKTDSEGDW